MADRAAFELECPKQVLSVRPLTRETFDNTDAPLYQGVVGCGKRAVYVATLSGYVLNSESGAVIAAQPPPQPPPPAPVVH